MKLKNRFLSTYSKIIISQYRPLKAIITAHTLAVDEDQKILSSEQINEVLNGPYGHFTQLAISAYATFSKLISGLNLVQDTLFKTKRVNISKEVKLPQHLKNYPLTKITALEKNLGKTLTENHQIWQKQLEEWENELLEVFKSIAFSLSEIETREFQSKETISTVLNQFTEFKITLPKINLHSLTFTDYLTLKTYLAIHNSLARRQKPSAHLEIMNILKKLMPTLTTIRKKEKEILQEQKKKVQKIIHPIEF